MNPDLLKLGKDLRLLIDRVDDLDNNLNQGVERVFKLEDLMSTHDHSDSEGITSLTKTIKLGKDQFLQIADSNIGQYTDSNVGTSFMSLSVGIDTVNGYTQKTNNLQLDLVHQWSDPSKVSYLRSIRPPAYTNFSPSNSNNHPISTTLGGTTATITAFNFTVNELAGATINIYDSTGNYIETQVIASNTATVITIAGTWFATTGSALFIIYYPVYIGISDFPFQRLYVREGSGGGIRFGVGPTNGGIGGTGQRENTLLFMDNSTGDLYYRDKQGNTEQLAMPIAARAYMNSNQTIVPGSTKVLFNAETFDSRSNFDPVTNHRFTASVAGYYQVNTAVYYVATENLVNYFVSITKNGATVTTGVATSRQNFADVQPKASDVVFLAVTDYIEIFTAHVSVGNVDISSGADISYVSIIKV